MKVLAVLLLSVLAAASALTFHPITAPTGWQRLHVAPHPDHRIKLSFALRQRNLDVLERTLLEVSSPRSPRFGKHLSMEQLRDLVAPEPECVEDVVRFLEQHGFTEIDVPMLRDYVVAWGTVDQIEALLQTRIGLYSFRDSPQSILRAVQPYTIPEKIEHAVESVPGLIGFPYSRLSLARPSEAARGVFEDVTPDFLIKQYDITPATAAVKNSSQAVVEFDFNWFSQKDLDTFFDRFYPAQKGQEVTDVYGQNRPDIHTGIEANLDVQYIMAMGQFVNTTAYSMPFNSNILDSFLEYTQLANNQTDAPLVHSISFGEYGGHYPNETVQRINTGFQQMGVRGISILLASGDNGVGCNAQCTSQEFDFPSSPYITMVGGTEFSSGSGEETGARFSSGGFSRDYWTAPYQVDAVNTYLNSGVDLPDPSFYFANGRAYPDVSAAGQNVQIVVNGRTEPVGGTSCAAPIWAGIISLLNNERFQAGKGPLGFLNQILYENPSAMTDIVKGSNPYMCCPGFEATTGWDPVTGLGSPNYPELLKLALSLP